MHFFHLGYLRDSIFHPNVLDYIRSGRGIAARYRRCHRYWQSHINNCIEFQKKALSEVSSNRSVSVLGAGRCYDTDLHWLLSCFELVRLYDADPGCLREWKKVCRDIKKSLDAESNQASLYNRRVVPHLGDLSGTIDTWTRKLSDFAVKHRGAEIEVFAEFLSELELESALLIEGNVVLSLNLLGQVPIYWRDRVHEIFARILKIDTDDRGHYENVLQESLDETFAKLQRQQLELLSKSGAEAIVLFTDIEYCYFKAGKADWQVESALYVDDIEIPGYRETATQEWYWDLAPQGIENKDYGEAHRVRAVAYTLI